MRSRRVVTWFAVSISAALVVSACGGSGGDSTGGAGGDPSATVITVNGSEPQNPLVPSNTNETEGGKVVDALWTGLVEYDSDTNEPRNAVAESIATTDNVVYTITLGQGWTFHDGTVVDAASFVDAWNYAAYGPNGQANASFFNDIVGYTDVNPTDPDGDSGPQAAPAPAAETMSGLRVVDDLTFEVTLVGPSSVFPVKLGYTVFYPMPDSFFADPTAFEANPIGNGAFRFVSRTPNTNIILEAYPEYGGDTKPSIGGVEFRNYAQDDAAYQDVVAGNLDFINRIPGLGLTGNVYQSDLPDRNGSEPRLGITTMAYPLYDARYQNVDLRRAISMAIDREAVNQQVYNGLNPPADGFVSPSAPGYLAGQCGEFCTYQPERARAMFDATGFQGPIELVTNVDRGENESWMRAACITITNSLGRECNFVPIPTFAEFLDDRDARTLTQIFRTGWQGDYPSIENFLSPIYRTGAGSNDGEYTNPAFDALLDQASLAPTLDEAEVLYQQAEQVLVQDMPAIPMFFPTDQYGWSERLGNIKLTIRGELDLMAVTVS